MQETEETRVRSLGREEPLQEEMATHSSILVWKWQFSWMEISMDRGAWKAIVHRVAKNQTWLSTYTHTHSHSHTRTFPQVFLNLKQPSPVFWQQILTTFHASWPEFAAPEHLPLPANLEGWNYLCYSWLSSPVALGGNQLPLLCSPRACTQ